MTSMLSPLLQHPSSEQNQPTHFESIPVGNYLPPLILTSIMMSAAIFLVAGCARQPKAEDVLRSQATAAVIDTLIDPQSAQFSDWKYYPLQKAACGRVNAKNRLGGYTGRSFFAFKAGELKLADGDTLSDLTVRNRCARFGLEEYNIEHATDRAARKERQAERAAKGEGGVDAK